MTKKVLSTMDTIQEEFLLLISELLTIASMTIVEMLSDIALMIHLILIDQQHRVYGELL